MVKKPAAPKAGLFTDARQHRFSHHLLVRHGYRFSDNGVGLSHIQRTETMTTWHTRARMAILALATTLPLAAAAQQMQVPQITVSDQVILNGYARIESVYSEGPGFVVIHIDNNGAPGPVAGFRSVGAGETRNLDVPVDAALATPVLYAMLHVDDSEVGTYEFGTVEGADAPVAVDGQIVAPAFGAAVISAFDQTVDSTFTAANVVIETDGWLVIHADADGAPGPVIGQTLIEAGNSADVVVELDTEGITPVLWPMLHVDDGEIGVYEFGAVQGADGPVVLGGTVATVAVTNGPALRVAPQVVIAADGMMMDDMTPQVIVESVHLGGPGWVVIHTDNNGAPGPVAGFAAFDGSARNLVVTLDQDVPLTPVLWPMLHVDDSEIGTYEFGTVEGADAPVANDEGVITFPIAAAPSIAYTDQTGFTGTITIPEALIDAAGWLVIHADADGAPGPVIGQAPLAAGLNRDITVAVDVAEAGEQVFPMLHYDTGTPGVYEFGSVEGADLPVSVGGRVIVGPISLSS
jgi:hypothetical protein